MGPCEEIEPAGGDLGWGQCSSQDAGGRPGLPETGVGSGGHQGPGCAGPGRRQWGSGFLLMMELVGAGGRQWATVCARRRGESSQGVWTRSRKCRHALHAVGSMATTRSSSPVRVSPGAEERKPM